MRCKKCGGRWIIGNQVPVPKECPICDNDLSAGLSVLEPETIDELLYYMISEMGTDILQDFKKICAYIDDLFPDKKEDRSAWENLFANHLGEYMSKWIKNNPSTEVIDKVVGQLSEEKVRDDLYRKIYFLVGIDKIPGSRFDTPDYYLSVYDSFSEYSLKKRALVKAYDKCQAYDRQKILWKIIAIEEENQDADIEHHLDLLVKLKDRTALLKLIHLYETGGLVKRNREKAYELLHENEKSSDTEVLYQLGRYYSLGWSGTVDFKISEAYFQRAADNGSAKAQYQLYNLYINKEGLINRALEYLIRAAEQDYLPAVHQLAIRTFYGKGVEKDVHKAMGLLQENAEKGYQSSADKLVLFSLLLKEGT